MLSSAATARSAACAAAMDAGMEELDERTSASTAAALLLLLLSTTTAAATTGDEEDDTACEVVVDVEAEPFREELLPRGEGGGDDERAAAARTATTTEEVGLPRRVPSCLLRRSLSAAAPLWRGVADSARMAEVEEKQEREAGAFFTRPAISFAKANSKKKMELLCC